MFNIDYEIICDSREKVNEHILNSFKRNNINYRVEKLAVGDYRVEYKGYRPSCIIERKSNLDELILNLTDANKDSNEDNRFTRKLKRAVCSNQRVYIVIEDLNWYENLLSNNYRSKAKSNAVRGMLISLMSKYPNHLSVHGVKKELAGSFINSLLYYALKEGLKYQNIGKEMSTNE